MSGFAVAFSTSSPVASVALLGLDGRVIWSGERASEMTASKVCVELLELALKQTRLRACEATIYLADVGPGSFSGVRVGVMLAKALAFQRGQVAGATAFDLIATDRAVYLPSRKGELFVRVPGQEPIRAQEAPADAVGYTSSGGLFPSAAAFSNLWSRLKFVSSELLMPGYLIEPSISQPKQPYGVNGG